MNTYLRKVLVLTVMILGICICSGAGASNSNPPEQPKDVDWTQDASLKLQKIELKRLRSYVRGEELPPGGLQGMALTDRYLVFAQVTKNENNTMLHILDKNTLELLGTVDSYCFRHANDITFNKHTNEVLIVVGPQKIARFKITDNAGERFALTGLSFADCARTYSGIAYDAKTNRYMAYSAGQMYVLDSQFRELYSFPLRRGLVPQGMAYHNGVIYYSCYELGAPKRKIYNSKEKGSNLIYTYDLQGNLLKTLYIPNTSVKGEIESLDFDENGKMIIGYNILLDGKRTVTFYQSDNR